MIKIHKAKKHYWYTVVSPNGKILVTSETYKTRQGCEKGMNAMITIIRDSNFKIKDLTEVKQPKGFPYGHH